MFRKNYSSALLEDVVDQLASLPGIGRKTALRLALYLLRQPVENVKRLSDSIFGFRHDIRYCPVCNMISDNEKCPICDDPARDRSVICVVENHRDVLSIENTGQYRGLYHVLGGIISPIDGVGPGDLPIKELLGRAADDEVKEIILALNTGMEGETTSFYIFRQLVPYSVTVSTIARGVGFGTDLEYTDELTLGRSILNRQLFKPQ